MSAIFHCFTFFLLLFLLRTQVVISVEPASGDKSLLKDEVLQELLDQLNSPLISFATVGHEEDSKSSKNLSLDPGPIYAICTACSIRQVCMVNAHKLHVLPSFPYSLFLQFQI